MRPVRCLHWVDDLWQLELAFGEDSILAEEISPSPAEADAGCWSVAAEPVKIGPQDSVFRLAPLLEGLQWLVLAAQRSKRPTVALVHSSILAVLDSVVHSRPRLALAAQKLRRQKSAHVHLLVLAVQVSEVLELVVRKSRFGARSVTCWYRVEAVEAVGG